MPTDISLFDYILPNEFIAQSPAEPRESAKLLVVSKTSSQNTHRHISDLADLLLPSDILVLNNTKVFKARLHGVINGKQVELFLVRPIGKTTWEAIGKPWKRFSIGENIFIADDFEGTVVSKNQDGILHIDCKLPVQEVIRLSNMHGSVPLPPYIKKTTHQNAYQTSYAKIVGSVAAPTAGFHITKNILETIKKKGVTVCEITLHVGLGTFKPVKTKTLEEHVMHREWVSVSKESSDIIRNAKKLGRRVIAVGTTTVRTLEGVSHLHNGSLVPYEGDVNIFISPGFRFTVVDGMLTNFHLPKSTLLILVSAFAGREKILESYQEAMREKYRFYSFGDAMFIS